MPHLVCFRKGISEVLIFIIIIIVFYFKLTYGKHNWWGITSYFTMPQPFQFNINIKAWVEQRTLAQHFYFCHSVTFHLSFKARNNGINEKQKNRFYTCFKSRRCVRNMHYFSASNKCHTAISPRVEIEDFCRKQAGNILCLNDQTNIACFMIIRGV